MCPWYALTDYAHSTGEIDQLFDELIDVKDLSETSLALAMNRIHYFNATKRFATWGCADRWHRPSFRYEQSKVCMETLLESFPSSIELWIEYLLNPTITTEISVVRLGSDVRMNDSNFFSSCLNVPLKRRDRIMNWSMHWYSFLTIREIAMCIVCL